MPRPLLVSFQRAHTCGKHGNTWLISHVRRPAEKLKAMPTFEVEAMVRGYLLLSTDLEVRSPDRIRAGS